MLDRILALPFRFGTLRVKFAGFVRAINRAKARAGKEVKAEEELTVCLTEFILARLILFWSIEIREIHRNASYVDSIWRLACVVLFSLLWLSSALVAERQPEMPARERLVVVVVAVSDSVFAFVSASC